MVMGQLWNTISPRPPTHPHTPPPPLVRRCVGYPQLCPAADCTMPLNLAKNETFDRIEKLMQECTGGAASAPGKPSGLFPDDFIHLGGDEVDPFTLTHTPRHPSTHSRPHPSSPSPPPSSHARPHLPPHTPPHPDPTLTASSPHLAR